MRPPIRLLGVEATRGLRLPAAATLIVLVVGALMATILSLLSQQRKEREDVEEHRVLVDKVSGCFALANNLSSVLTDIVASQDVQGGGKRWKASRQLLGAKLDELGPVWGRDFPEEKERIGSSLDRADREMEVLLQATARAVKTTNATEMCKAMEDAGDARGKIDQQLAATLGALRETGEGLMKSLADRIEQWKRRSEHLMHLFWWGSAGLALLILGTLLWMGRLEAANRALLREADDRARQLLQSEKMAGLGQIAAGVAHEINNPVGFVMSNLGTLAGYVGVYKKLLAEYETLSQHIESGGADGKAQEIQARIREIREKEDLPYIQQDVDTLLSESSEGTQRIKEIVQSLKSFAHIDEAQVKEANVNDCIETTLKVIWNELKYKCNVVKNLGNLPLIRCYPGQLNQVFMNLLVNAAQAIPERGEVRIETRASDEEVLVRISDTGSGISKENLSKLFTPFFTTKPVGKGTGLGLSVAFGIIQKHGGTIEVQSEVGKGTTFTIHLPLRGGGGGDES